MTADKKIRDSRPEDIGAIEALYAAAFPGADLLPLVRDLLDLKDGVISPIALADGAVAGHIAFTICGVEAAPDKVALLAPLAVLPAAQKQGIGRAHPGRVRTAGTRRVGFRPRARRSGLLWTVRVRARRTLRANNSAFCRNRKNRMLKNAQPD
ncbi:MAG: GNAT family N-acetyltransferase [Alphaproteobacteria bacterium]